VSADYLSQLGVLYYRIPSEADVDKLASERSYKNRDIITVSPEKMGAIYEEKVKSFFHEHLHEDEEIRYIRDGTGFFDVRSEGDEWVRIFLEKDDLIVGDLLKIGIGADEFRFCQRVFITGLRRTIRM
jgi:1,2-dihydroxy-3-keto-5-methylthiopentene dioxygenase